MAAPHDRRAELLSMIVSALVAGGVGDLSLRPLAARVGTSARLLIYHFGSKEQLIAAALEAIRGHVAQELARRAAARQPEDLRALVGMFWDWAIAPQNQGYFRVLFEVDGLAMFDRIAFSRQARAEDSASWVTLIQRGAERWPDRRGSDPADALLIARAVSGLLQEYLSTGDSRLTSAALTRLIDLIESQPHPARGKSP